MQSSRLALIFINDDGSTVEVSVGMTVEFKDRFHLIPGVIECNPHPEFRTAKVSKITSRKIFLDVSKENQSKILTLPHSHIREIKIV